MLSVETHRDELVLVERVHQWVRVDAHRRCIKHDLVDGGKLLEEEEDTWPDKDIHLDRSSFDLDPHLKIASTTGAACT